MKKRSAGILLPIFSLPSKHGIGDLGPEAYRFVDFLVSGRQSFWQILPINESDPATYFSPYSCLSVFAGNTLYISPERLLRDGWLRAKDVPSRRRLPGGSVDYKAVHRFKEQVLGKAYRRSKKKLDEHRGFLRFCSQNAFWLDEYALFIILKAKYRKRWCHWPRSFRDRDAGSLESVKSAKKDELRYVKFTQYLFYQQWTALRSYCKKKKIGIMGDMPIYVHYESSDVWANPHLFKLRKNKRPRFVSGVPPDYFSKTGQYWGSPVYDWTAHRKEGYRWWLKRFEHKQRLFDWLRIDHFRGFVAYWEVPAQHKTAQNGHWVKAPGKKLFGMVTKKFPNLKICAEDIGYITPPVHRLRRHFGFPGMKVLLFAFGEDLKKHPYLPHNCERNSFVYTGTHDNNTVKGWFQNEASRKDKNNLNAYLGEEVTAENVNEHMIRLAFSARSLAAVIPLQDWLGIGAPGRVNTPGTKAGNWKWRVSPGDIDREAGKRIRMLTERYKRERA